MGRHTADFFGFKDAQKQWSDARLGPTGACTQYGTKCPHEDDQERQHAPVPTVSKNHHATNPKTVQANVTAMGTAYVGDHAFKHGSATHWTQNPKLKYSYITTAALKSSAPPKNQRRPDDEETQQHSDLDGEETDPIGVISEKLGVDMAGHGRGILESK